jgi:hypothetical protein
MRRRNSGGYGGWDFGMMDTSFSKNIVSTKTGQLQVEAACGRALLLKAYSYKSVESILKTNLDKQELPGTPSAEKPIIHYNIRGREYYQQKEAPHA